MKIFKQPLQDINLAKQIVTDIEDSSIGNQTSAIGDYSVAVGNCTSAIGEGSYAAGLESIASGDYSHAEGWETYSEGEYSHSEGDYTMAQGFASHAEGGMTYANGEYSHTEGVYSSTGDCSHAEGTCTIADTMHGHAEGYATAAGTIVKIGQLNVLTCITDPAGKEWKGTEQADANYDAISVYWKLTLDDEDGSAGKKLVDFIGTNEIEFGYEGANKENTIIPCQICKSASNYQLTAYNFAKVPGSMMWDNKILLSVDNGEYSSLINCFADKKNNSNVGSYFSDANPTTANAVDVYALNAILPNGEYLDNTIYAKYSHAEGQGTIAAGSASHAEGQRTRAFGSAAHAEGYDTAAIGRGSKVNGVHSFAEGKFSTAVGKCVNSKGDYSIAAGNCCTASHERSFVWSGPYTGHSTNSYTSKENGTFCINPDTGLSGFFIGNDNFIACVYNAIQQMSNDQKTALANALLQSQS